MASSRLICRQIIIHAGEVLTAECDLFDAFGNRCQVPVIYRLDGEVVPLAAASNSMSTVVTKSGTHCLRAYVEAQELPGSFDFQVSCGTLFLDSSFPPRLCWLLCPFFLHVLNQCWVISVAGTPYPPRFKFISNRTEGLVLGDEAAWTLVVADRYGNPCRRSGGVELRILSSSSRVSCSARDSEDGTWEIELRSSVPGEVTQEIEAVVDGSVFELPALKASFVRGDHKKGTGLLLFLFSIALFPLNFHRPCSVLLTSLVFDTSLCFAVETEADLRRKWCQEFKTYSVLTAKKAAGQRLTADERATYEQLRGEYKTFSQDLRESTLEVSKKHRPSALQ